MGLRFVCEFVLFLIGLLTPYLFSPTNICQTKSSKCRKFCEISHKTIFIFNAQRSCVTTDVDRTPAKSIWIR